MEMLENNIIVPFDSLENETEAKTLNVVESRQFRCRGLLHISDATHAFFLLLEQQRVDQINQYHLLHEQGQMVEAALIKIGDDEDLKDKFSLFFNMENAGDTRWVLTTILIANVVNYYWHILLKLKFANLISR